jgi:EAL domain-containing protein (putative c-di-GMP-specific phosphodiesterase class I)
VVQALRTAGVRVALDDFGTGHSSLRSLTQLPVDILKLTRCIVAELDGSQERSAVAEAVMRLAEMLRLDIAAESIDQPTQATDLALRGCHNVQGYQSANRSRPRRSRLCSEIRLLDGPCWPGCPSVSHTTGPKTNRPRPAPDDGLPKALTGLVR